MSCDALKYQSPTARRPYSHFLVSVSLLLLLLLLLLSSALMLLFVVLGVVDAIKGCVFTVEQEVFADSVVIWNEEGI